MANGAAGAKVCMLCGKDCSAVPRIKNDKGEYACRSCVDAKKGAGGGAAAAGASRGNGGGDDVMMGLLADLPQAGGTPKGPVCPACYNPIAAGAVLCTRCGHNSSTGQAVKTRVQKKADGESAGAKALAATGTAAAPLFALIGACAGGAVGAGLWAAVAYFAHFEIGWIAWIVGLLAGGGALVATGGRGGIIAGGIAAVVSVAAIGAGKFAAVSISVDEVARQFATVSDDTLLMRTTFDLAWEWEEEGRTVAWKDGTDWDTAEYPDDFPDDILAAGQDAFDGMSSSERAALRSQMESEVASFMSVAKDEGFMASWGWLDAVFVLLAVGTAFKVGAGMGDE